MVDEVLEELSTVFNQMYSDVGRPSIPPEQLLRALLLQVLYTVRSERLLMEQLNYNLLFRWFVGLGMDDEVWVPTVFSKNRDRLLAGDVSELFFRTVVEKARQKRLLSDEHFTVDGTLIDAWAGQKSFRRKGKSRRRHGRGPRNPEVNFHREKRSNETHQSRTDPEARMFRKGMAAEAKLSYMGHVLMDNRHGLVVDAAVTAANGTAEREAAVAMITPMSGSRRITLGGDKGYDTRGFVSQVRALNVTPHVAQKRQFTALDNRTIRHEGYRLSQRKRKRVEEVFGWMKTIGTMRKTRHRGKARVGWMFTFTAAAYNLIRIRNLTAEAC
jgi:transposase